MTSANPGPRLSRPAADNDIYTVLMCIAFLFLLTATIYVAYRAITQLGGLFPAAGL